MSWQKCPVCNGTGRSPMALYGTESLCGACNGHAIIHELTGKPPAGPSVVTTTGMEITWEFSKDGVHKRVNYK